VAEGTEQMKRLAEKEGQPLVNLAIQWVANQPGVTSVLLGARDAEQARQNASAMNRPVSEQTLAELTRISDEVVRHMPDVGNIFRHYP
jgi:aryl-alcohol dehydrogenase-like predicted oxidoreductase